MQDETNLIIETIIIRAQARNVSITYKDAERIYNHIIKHNDCDLDKSIEYMLDEISHRYKVNTLYRTDRAARRAKKKVKYKVKKL